MKDKETEQNILVQPQIWKKQNKRKLNAELWEINETKVHQCTLIISYTLQYFHSKEIKFEIKKLLNYNYFILCLLTLERTACFVSFPYIALVQINPAHTEPQNER